MYRDPVPVLEATGLLPAATRALRVGMIGIGTVGGGTFRVLARNQRQIAARAGRGIEIVAVAARDLQRAARIVGPEVPVTSDPFGIATHPGVDVVVEVAGGTGAARDWVLCAIAHGKHVVTANKALLAVHGEEIFAAARARGVAVAYEGAVAVSIPIVKALREGLAANRVEWLAGIINGTSNFILSKMRDEGVGFAEALGEAQALGYAEADPAFDVQGIDAAHKLTLLAATAFGMPLRFAEVHVEGIDGLEAADVRGAEQMGFRIKLLGVARRTPEGVELRVQPTLLLATQLLAQVNGSMNGVMVKGDAAGVTMYYGAGAGAEQTASAVIADLVDLARLDGVPPAQQVPHLGVHPHATEALPVLPRSAARGVRWLRVPLVAGQELVALQAALAAHGVWLQRAVWADDTPAAAPEALCLTEPLVQAILDDALRALAAHPGVRGPVKALPVETLDA
ncbi:homoserine dehydrogenase [Xenophilus aerolatus]|nr:homoserine dehydrogenase [Xenophilus aerolatus]